MDKVYSDLLGQAQSLLTRQALGDEPLTAEELLHLDALLDQLRALNQPPVESPPDNNPEALLLRRLDDISAQLDALQKQGAQRREPVRSSVSDLLLGVAVGLLSFSGLAVTLFLLFHGFAALSALTGLAALPLAFLSVSIVLGLVLLGANEHLTDKILAFLFPEKYDDNL